MTVPDTETDIGTADRSRQAPGRSVTIRTFGLTDTGKVRSSNEDHFVIVELARAMYVHQSSILQATAQYSSHRGHILLVADGMGGHNAGEVASSVSVLTIEDFLLNSLKRFFRLADGDEQAVMKEFHTALLQADAKILEEAAEHPDMLGMGTTLTLAFVVDSRLFVAHAGDSRCYLYSRKELHQVTHDHTLVAELVRRGALSSQDAMRHRLRHVVTNCLGGKEPGVQVELHRMNLEPDDMVLLCSDGLTEMLSDERIASILEEDGDPEQICKRLVREANEAGGKDNITVLVAVLGTP